MISSEEGRKTLNDFQEWHTKGWPEATSFLRQHFPDASDLVSRDGLVVQTPDFTEWYFCPLGVDGKMSLLVIQMCFLNFAGGTEQTKIIALQRWASEKTRGLYLFEMIGGSFLLLFRSERDPNTPC